MKVLNNKNEQLTFNVAGGEKVLSKHNLLSVAPMEKSDKTVVTYETARAQGFVFGDDVKSQFVKAE
jgi:hypothetical protein